MSAEKRDAGSMEVDQEIEDAIFEELSKKQCFESDEQSLEEQFQDALSNVQERAAIDRQKLVKKACDHYVARNGCAPSVDELEEVFEDLADKAFDSFGPQEDASSDSSDSEEEDSESEADGEDLSAINSNHMTSNLLDQVNDALDHVHELAKKDKAKLTKSVQEKWKSQNGSEISADETEAVFAVIGKMFKDGPSSVSPGDEDEEDADYEPTEDDKQKEEEDATLEESEGEDEQDTFVALDGDLEFTSPTVQFGDVLNEVLEELGLEVDEEEEETIEYSENIEVNEKLVESIKKACPEATEEDITDLLTSKLADAEFDEADDAEYEPEADQEQDEAGLFEDFSLLGVEADEEETGPVKFLNAELGDSDGEEYGFDDFAADHQDEQDSDEYSDSDAELDDDADYTSSKQRPAGSVEQKNTQQQAKQIDAAAMDVETPAQLTA